MEKDKPTLTPSEGAGSSAPDPAAGPKPEAGSKPKAGRPGEQDDKPVELTAEELRLMADTMPGEGPGDD